MFSFNLFGKHLPFAENETRDDDYQQKSPEQSEKSTAAYADPCMSTPLDRGILLSVL